MTEDFAAPLAGKKGKSSPSVRAFGRTYFLLTYSVIRKSNMYVHIQSVYLATAIPSGSGKHFKFSSFRIQVLEINLLLIAIAL